MGPILPVLQFGGPCSALDFLGRPENRPSTVHLFGQKDDFQNVRLLETLDCDQLRLYGQDGHVEGVLWIVIANIITLLLCYSSQSRLENFEDPEGRQSSCLKDHIDIDIDIFCKYRSTHSILV